MDPRLGWLLAIVAIFVGYRSEGWLGVALAASAIVFWLLLQLNRALKVMRGASHAPVGHVASAVMLNARLKRGLLMLQVVDLTKSLGRALPGRTDAYLWTDAGGSEVVVEFAGGRVRSWTLSRPDVEAAELQPPTDPA